jgi:hypothetical protein
LINEQNFYIVYDGRKNYTSKIAGKRYNIQMLSEVERASQAIADLLELNYAIVEEKESTVDAGAEAFTAAGAPEIAPPAEEPAPEEAPVEEIPPA